MMRRGDIHYIEDTYRNTGSEQKAGRPAVIVSNDANNAHSATVEIVWLTTAPKHNLPVHVQINSTSRTSIALCEQITSVAVERIGSYYATCSDEELRALDKALALSLDLPKYEPSYARSRHTDSEYEKLVEELNNAQAALKEAETKRDMYQTMYDSVMSKLIK